MEKIAEANKIKGKITIRAYKAGTKELLQEIVQDNLIMQAANLGKDLIIQRLLGTNTYSLNINYGAIGTGSTAPAVTDTQLATETNRTTVTYSQDSGFDEAILQFFFPDSVLTNQTYYEFGTFVDGTATANSGQLFNHALFGTPYAKTAGVDTTVEVDITLT
jgi:hypothetical protein